MTPRSLLDRLRPVLLPLLCAAAWPVQAAESGTPENLLITLLRSEAADYEHGNGVERDGARAVALYCRAARLGDTESQFNLGWMYTNGRGVERNDSLAAFFFHAAAEQGMEQAIRMLGSVGGPTTDVPDCMREPAVPKPRVVAAAPRPAPPVRPIVAPHSIAELVKKIAPEYRVPTQLVLAIIQAESNFDIVALSPKNAKGLMQLIPDTAARFNVRNPYDPAQNIRGGVAYLRWLLAYFEGDVTLVAAAYNAGEGTVERYRGVPPYVETRAYVRKIVDAVGTLIQPFDGSATQPSAKMQLLRAPRLSK
ncbi:MAG: transglycosylase SLT domain-containing protein [Burkholderiales bacterium]|nr:transglycosylase SLT domain-containing protein [Burkholderiales bacterium]